MQSRLIDRVQIISLEEFKLATNWLRPQDVPRKNKMPKAPKSPLKPLTSWSWSRLLLWEQCPRQFMYRNLDPATKDMFKIADAELSPTSALGHGKIVHKVAEDFVNERDKAAKCPDALYCFEDEFAAVRKIPRARRQTEVAWAFDRQWKPCSPTDWENCWLRFTADLTWDAPIIRTVIDHKTGKLHGYNQDQARLGALCALLVPPFRKSAKSSLWYLELGQEQTQVLLATQIEEEKVYWEKRVAPMFADADFLPKPDVRRCSYCIVSFSKTKNRPANEGGSLCPHG